MPHADLLTGPSLPEWLGRQARTRPDALALVSGPVRWSFGELDDRAARAARRLASLGVRAESRIALCVRAGAPFTVLLHALARLGAVAVPLNTRLAAPELAWQLNDSGAAFLIADREADAAERAAAASGTRHAAVTPDGLVDAPELDVSLRETVDLSADWGIVYTSATSGRPKGVRLTYGNHWWSAVGSALRLGAREDDCWLAPLALYHVGGLAILWRSVISGIPAVLHDAFDPAAVNRDIDGGTGTIISVVATMLQRLLEARGYRPFPAALRCVLLGGGPAPAALLAVCAGLGVPVATTYGLTETASQVATLTPAEQRRKPGSSGAALMPMMLRVERDQTSASAGEIGEILVRGPSVMRGYAGRPEDTERALRGGWLRTGDLGYLDAGGYLYVVDRRDDLIITGGENVYPAEVEAVLCEHADVADAGVVGIPDAVWGQSVAAWVTLRGAGRPAEDDLRAFCGARLARYKVPRRIRFAGALPRSAGGKLLRRKLREWAADPSQGRGEAEPPHTGAGGIGAPRR